MCVSYYEPLFELMRSESNSLLRIIFNIHGCPKQYETQRQFHKWTHVHSKSWKADNLTFTWSNTDQLSKRWSVMPTVFKSKFCLQKIGPNPPKLSQTNKGGKRPSPVCIYLLRSCILPKKILWMIRSSNVWWRRSWLLLIFFFPPSFGVLHYSAEASQDFSKFNDLADLRKSFMNLLGDLGKFHLMKFSEIR